MSVKVLLPQPILPEGYAYLKDHGFEVVDGRGFTEDDIIADILSQFQEKGIYVDTDPQDSCLLLHSAPPFVLL